MLSVMFGGRLFHARTAAAGRAQSLKELHLARMVVSMNVSFLDLGIVSFFAEILNALNKGNVEDALNFLGFLTLQPTTTRF